MKRSNKLPNIIEYNSKDTFIVIYSKGIEYRAIIDFEDIGKVSQYKWCLSHGYPSSGSNSLKLHTVIMGQKNIDHINGNILDNRKSNLRVASQCLNMKNMRKPIHNTTGYKGVSFDRWCGKYKISINCDSTHVNIGRVDDIEYGAWLYDQYAIQLFGEFARTNFEYF